VRNHETSYKKTLEWTKNTGQGIREKDGAATFESKAGIFNYEM